MEYYKSVTVYLGSGGKVKDHYRDTVKDFVKLAKQKEVSIVYGGMCAGTMGVLADTCLDLGVEITGVVPRNIKDFTILHPTLKEQDKLVLTDDMWERKKEMVARGDAAIIFPGGYGTLDELFEFLYWGMAGYHDKPCVLINENGYWSPIISFIQKSVDQGLVGRRVLDMLISVEDTDKVFDQLDSWHKEHHNPEFDPDIFTQGNDYLGRIEIGNMEATSDPIIVSSPNMESTYKLANALVLKQLNKITRAIGVLDKNPTMNHLQDWIKIAVREKFITPNCAQLIIFEDDEARLTDRLARHKHISSDLREKWDNT